MYLYLFVLINVELCEKVKQTVLYRFQIAYKTGDTTSEFAKRALVFGVPGNKWIFVIPIKI